MSKPREDLQVFLEEFLGSRNVYFQPPPSVKLKYPAIIYSLTDIDNLPANDYVYAQNIAYQVTIVDYDPDSDISKRFSFLPLCRFNRFYTADNLNHFVYILYY